MTSDSHYFVKLSKPTLPFLSEQVTFLKYHSKYRQLTTKKGLDWRLILHSYKDIY